MLRDEGKDFDGGGEEENVGFRRKKRKENNDVKEIAYDYNLS